MLLFWTTLIFGLLLAVKGLAYIFVYDALQPYANWFLRSKQASFLFFGGASAWFLWIISNLGEADFGQYKHWLFILFALVAIVSFIKLPDFLAVRGWCVLSLLISRWILDVAFMEEPASRLFLVSFIYLWIVMALYLAVVPYRVRDLVTWLNANTSKRKMIGTVVALYGLLLIIVAFGY